MFQDIRMPRKSLREVLPGNGAEVTPRARKARKLTVEEEELPPLPRPRRQRQRRPLGPKMIWLAIVLIVVLAAGFFISKMLSTVSVQVASKEIEISLNGSAFTVPYESVTIPTIKDERPVKAQLTNGTPKKASGVIVVYNNSDKSQTLVASTRFEAASGKIYRIPKAVTIPAGKSIETTVVADQAGLAYNAPLTDFKIPGFKGDPKYDKFSAKSKTAMTGGSSGQEWTMNEADHAKVLADLKQSLLAKAAEQVRFQIPDNFVLYEGSIIPTFKEDFSASALTVSLDARAIIFDRDILSQALATSVMTQVGDQSFTITNLDKLGISLDQNSLKSDDKKVTIIADGKAAIRLTVDPNILRSKLIGVNAAKAQEIFTQFPAVKQADVSFHPPWIREFPATVDRIKVVIP